MENKNERIYVVFSKNMATAIRFLTGEQYHKRDGDNGSTIYTFIDSERIRRAVKELSELKKTFFN